MGSHLQHSAHSDTSRLTSPNPKMILVIYKIVAHPEGSSQQRDLSVQRHDPQVDVGQVGHVH